VTVPKISIIQILRRSLETPRALASKTSSEFVFLVFFVQSQHFATFVLKILVLLKLFIDFSRKSMKTLRKTNISNIKVAKCCDCTKNTNNTNSEEVFGASPGSGLQDLLRIGIIGIFGTVTAFCYLYIENIGFP